MTATATGPLEQGIPDTDVSSILARAQELQPLVREYAAKGEQDRKVAQESIDALAAAGMFKIAQPRRYGGFETSVRTMLDVSAAIGEADGGTAWVVGILNVCAWGAGLLDRRAQDDIWAEDPDALICGVFAPTGESRRVEGGYRVTGRWYWNSASWHAGWFLLGVPIADETGTVAYQGLILVPRADLDHEETWFVAGMKSTGSNCVIAEDVFVPDHRVASVSDAMEGHYATEERDDTFYRVALMPLLSLVLAGPQLGMARAALRIVTEKAAQKPISYTYYQSQSESVAFQLQLAEAAMLIDTAHLHVHRAAADLDTAATQGVFPDYLTRARVRADCVYAVDRVVKAMGILLSAHGASSFAEVNQLQRIWRDSSVAARHAFCLPAVGYEIYGKALLGIDDQITPIV